MEEKNCEDWLTQFELRYAHVLCLYVFISVAGSGVTAMAHLDGTDIKSGVQQITKKMKRLCHGAPEGRLSIFFVEIFSCMYSVTFCDIL